MCAAGHLFLLCIDELWPTHPPGLFSCTLHMSVCPVLLLLSLASQMFCGLASAFRLFCILVLDGQCTVGAWRAARSWCACCLGEPRARGSVMNSCCGVLCFVMPDYINNNKNNNNNNNNNNNRSKWSHRYGTEIGDGDQLCVFVWVCAHARACITVYLWKI